MKKLIYLLLVFVLCGCNSNGIEEVPEAAEILQEPPEIHKEPEEAEEINIAEIAYKYLSLCRDNSRIIRYAMGDLNGDGIDDIAVVVEYKAEIEFYETGVEYSFNKISPRHIYVLLGDENGNHAVAHKHESLIKK
jgi:hypothetical protein